MLDWALLANGVLLGIGAAAPIGPVNVEIARRTLHHGFRAGFALGCGAVTVDVFFTLVSSLGLQPLVGRTWFYWTATAVGVVLLVYLGVMSWVAAARAWREAREEEWADPALPRARSYARHYTTGLMMTFLNPMTLAFWFGVVPGVAAGAADHPRRDLPIIATGVFVGTISWVVTFAGLLHVTGHTRGAARRRWWLVAADGLGGAVLLTFAVLAAWRALAG